MGSPNESKSYKDGAVLTTTTTDVEKDGDLMDQERTDQLRSRVAVDARGRLLDEEMEKHRKKGVRKIDFYAVPCLLLMWLANFIDRSVSESASRSGCILTDTLDIAPRRVRTSEMLELQDWNAISECMACSTTSAWPSSTSSTS